MEKDEGLLTFLKQNKKWWIIPLLLALALAVVVILLSQRSGSNQFGYDLF